MSAVNVAEFFAGLRPGERSRWAAFFGELRYWDVTPQVAMHAGVFRYDYARRGRTILIIRGALIAATAVAVGAILVTNNGKDFPMPELSLLSLPD